MTLDVKFEEQDQTFNTNFGEIQTVSDGGFERGYNEGYVQGEVEGYDKGKTDGLVDGYDKGKTDGLVEGYDKGKTDGRVEGEQVGFDNAVSKLTTLEVTENGEYTPSDDNIGFDKVTVNIGGEEKSKLAQRVDGTLTEVTANDLKGATKIGNKAFQNCSKLENVIIPNTVTVIEPSAFEYCSLLKNVVIPNSVQIISGYAFRYCYSITSIEIPDSVTDMSSGYEFGYCSRLASIKIGKGVQTLKRTFTNCTVLESAEIPDNVTSAEALFYSCSSLKSVTIGKGLTTLSKSIFYGCGFTDFVIPNHVVELKMSAFYGCDKMLNMTIPSSVTNIEAYALRMGLKYNQVTFTFLGLTPPTIANDTFQDIDYINKIIVPKGSLDAYKSATNWSKYADIMEEATE